MLEKHRGQQGNDPGCEWPWDSPRHAGECQLRLGKCLGRQEPRGWPGSPEHRAQPGQGPSHRPGHPAALEREMGGKKEKRIQASKAPAQLSSCEPGHGWEQSWSPLNLLPSYTDLGLWEGGLSSVVSPQQRQDSAPPQAHPIPQKQRHHAWPQKGTMPGPKTPSLAPNQAGARASLLHSRMGKHPALGSSLPPLQPLSAAGSATPVPFPGFGGADDGAQEVPSPMVPLPAQLTFSSPSPCV